MSSPEDNSTGLLAQSDRLRDVTPADGRPGSSTVISVPVALARSLSILGHPLVVIPAGFCALILYGDVPSAAVIVSVVCGISAIVFAFSFWQVVRGRWQHVDASARSERSSLNIFLAIVLLLGAVIGFYWLPEPGLPLGLLLSGLLIVLVMLASPWLKLSLHASFAAFAVLMLVASQQFIASRSTYAIKSAMVRIAAMPLQSR